jgi:hypothetical protein
MDAPMTQQNEMTSQKRPRRNSLKPLTSEVPIYSREWVRNEAAIIAKDGAYDRDKLKALELIARLEGHLVDRSQVTTLEADPEDLDMTKLSWDELQTLIDLQLKAGRRAQPQPAAGEEDATEQTAAAGERPQ